jgi:ligand-binding sensor domain-containing protein
LSLSGDVALRFSPEGVLWVATSRGVAHFDGEAWYLDATSGGATIHAFSFAPDGSLWLGTSKGAVHFHP